MRAEARVPLMGISQATREAAEVPAVMLDKYRSVETAVKGRPMRLFDEGQDKAAHKISALADIAWPDPFTTKTPEQSLELITAGLPEAAGDLVYQRSRFDPRYSPYVVYLPSDEVMFKMMRACLRCQEAQDLWVVPEEDDETIYCYCKHADEAKTAAGGMC